MRKRSKRPQVPSLRYLATPRLREQVATQGRRLNWLAEQIGVSKSFLSRVMAGERTIAEPDARVFVALIGGDFGVLFELPDGDEMNPGGSLRGDAMEAVGRS